MAKDLKISEFRTKKKALESASFNLINSFEVETKGKINYININRTRDNSCCHPSEMSVSKGKKRKSVLIDVTVEPSIDFDL